MDDMDEEGAHKLTCHVELEFEAPNSATLNKWCADTLRRLADSIEKDELEDGHHPVKDKVGETVGEVYVDYFDEF